MKTINLSYLITTRNKLPYLRQALTRLLAQVGDDEEIIVIDGGSTDGTADYLAELRRENKIHHFISEPDSGEAHGLNKGLLIARSELIKVLTDDDVFDYPTIRECKNFMLSHPRVDVLAGNIANAMLERPDAIEIVKESQDNYETWRRSGDPVAFTGLSLLMRRTSLPFLGLFATSTAYPDTEYTLRITSLGASIAWCTALIAVRIDNPQSNYRNILLGRRIEESDRMYYFYSGAYRKRQRNLPVMAAQQLWCALRSFKRRVHLQDGKDRPSSESSQLVASLLDSNVFDRYERWLSDHNREEACTFFLSRTSGENGARNSARETLRPNNSNA